MSGLMVMMLVLMVSWCGWRRWRAEREQKRRLIKRESGAHSGLTHARASTAQLSSGHARRPILVAIRCMNSDELHR